MARDDLKKLVAELDIVKSRTIDRGAIIRAALQGGHPSADDGTDKLTSQAENTLEIQALLDHCIFPRRKGAQSH